MKDFLSLWIAYAFFGFLQGLTEVFPVSSSAHIAILHAILSDFLGKTPIDFPKLIFLHLGTFLTILFVFRHDALLLTKSGLLTLRHRPPKFHQMATKEHPLGQHTPFYMIFSVAFTGAVGLALKGAAEDVFALPFWAAAALIANGICLLSVSLYLNKRGRPRCGIADLKLHNFILIGIVQGLAVIPGLSRFGLTLLASLLCGLAWYPALKLSFLLSLPTVLASASYELLTVHPEINIHALFPLFLGIFLASIGSWLAIRIIQRESLHAEQTIYHYGLYCLTTGLFFIMFLLFLA